MYQRLPKVPTCMARTPWLKRVIRTLRVNRRRKGSLFNFFFDDVEFAAARVGEPNGVSCSSSSEG